MLWQVIGHLMNQLEVAEELPEDLHQVRFGPQLNKHIFQAFPVSHPVRHHETPLLGFADQRADGGVSSQAFHQALP